MKTALLVIDTQKSFKARPFWSEANFPAWCQAQQRLIEGCVACHIPVIQVLHQTTDGGPFDPRLGLVATLDELRIEPDLLVRKHRHSALAGTALLDWLIGQNIQRLLISGIRTEQCCETTARHASDLGFQVDFFTDATLTFDMQDPQSGETVAAGDIQKRTELVLAGRFVRLWRVEEWLAHETAQES